jgi:AAA family ATP:ADP antiporter
VENSAYGNPVFSKWRAMLWPVHRDELLKLIPLLIIFFFISFDYNVLRTMKDTLVVTAKSSGAEVIPFIKLWVLLPGALLMTFLFTRLSNRWSQEKVFYVMVSTFLIFFFLFTFFLYPNREFLHPHQTADALEKILPHGLKGLVAMFRNWTLTLFYVMSELWSNIILSMLFWGFANQVTRINEAKRFYGIFGIGANLSGIFAGQASVFLCQTVYNPNLPFGQDAWEQTLILLVSLVIVVGIVAMLLFRWLHKKVLSLPRFYDNETVEQEKEAKGKLSIRETFGFLLRSRYMLCIAIITITYNLVINLVEVVWKHQLRELYPDPIQFNLYMNQVSTIIGIVATTTAIFISGNMIRKFGWTFTALLTPIILLVTSIGFFSFFFFRDSLSHIVNITLGTTPLAVVVFFGSAQNILCRGAKYTVFDATKEMAFVPLDVKSKLKGKAAIDGVCSRLGKSGGSLIHQSLLVTFSTIMASAPYVAGFLLVIIAIWMYATRYLGAQFNELTSSGSKSILHEKKPIKPRLIEEAV